MHKDSAKKETGFDVNLKEISVHDSRFWEWNLYFDKWIVCSRLYRKKTLNRWIILPIQPKIK